MSAYSIFTYIQSTPAVTWTINHNFSSAPTCDVIIADGDTFVKILPLSVKHVSDTQVLIEFSEATAGRARLFGKGKFFELASGAGTIDPGQNL